MISGQELRFEAGQIIPNTTALIVEGVVSYTFRQGRNELILYSGKGDWIGLDEGVEYVATCDTTIIQVEATPTRDLYASLLRQRKELIGLLLDARSSADVRIQHSLEKMARLFGVPDAQGTLIPKVSRADLHRMAGVNREYISRYVSRLVEEKKAIRIEKGIILKT